jgi:hypothetical protein
MEGTVEYVNPYEQGFNEVEGLGWSKLILGLVSQQSLWWGPHGDFSPS